MESSRPYTPGSRDTREIRVRFPTGVLNKMSDTIKPKVTPLQQKLLNKLKAARKSELRYQKEIDGIRAQILDKECTHLETTEYEWEWDNGYGRQKDAERSPLRLV